MRRYWIAVACADHVERARAGEFIQVCHGKAAPLRRLAAGDGLVCYSPSERFMGHDRLQAFTALGAVLPGEPWQVEMTEDFRPWRRRVAWASVRPAPIRPLLARLAFATGPQGWGYRMRFGLFAIGAADFRIIAAALGAVADVPAPPPEPELPRQGRLTLSDWMD